MKDLFHLFSFPNHLASTHLVARFCTLSMVFSALWVDDLHAGSPYVNPSLTMVAYALILLSLLQPNIVLLSRNSVPLARATVAVL